MNVIFIIVDSLRQDHVSAYHHGRGPFADVPACQTPGLDAFARDAVVFRNGYPEGLPTVPARLTLLTGQSTLPFRSWGPLAPHDLSLPEILRREGYTCGLVSDNYHLRAPNMNFQRGFQGVHWIRGQEYDPFESAPSRRNLDDYVNDKYPPNWRRIVSTCLSNSDYIQSEDQHYSAQVVDGAIDWLRRNREAKKTCLVVDCFDPHEPWDPPAAFDTYRDSTYTGKRLIMPMGGKYETWATEAEVRDIRGLYAGEAAFVDHSLGRLFLAMGELGYLDDSLVMLVSDHGHPLGDHGKFLKGTDRMYSELLKVPFLVRLPGGKGARRSDALVQFQDVLPTVLDVLGLGSNTGAFSGRSFWPVLVGEAGSHRSAIITGYHDGRDRCVRDSRWSLILRPEGEPDELYDLQSDPRECTNLIDQEPDEARRLAGLFGSIYFRGSRASTIKGVQAKYELSSGAVE